MTRPIYRVTLPTAGGLRYWSTLFKAFGACATVFRDEEAARDLMGKLASTGYPSVFVETGAETIETCAPCGGSGEIVGGLEQGCRCGGCFPHETCSACGGLGEIARLS